MMGAIIASRRLLLAFIWQKVAFNGRVKRSVLDIYISGLAEISLLNPHSSYSPNTSCHPRDRESKDHSSIQGADLLFFSLQVE
jgi:hypothetical protein